MTESSVFTGSAVLLILIACVCAVTGQWVGVIGSVLGALNAWAARWFLLKWKPSAATE